MNGRQVANSSTQSQRGEDRAAAAAAAATAAAAAASSSSPALLPPPPAPPSQARGRRRPGLSWPHAGPWLDQAWDPHPCAPYEQMDPWTHLPLPRLPERWRHPRPRPLHRRAAAGDARHGPAEGAGRGRVCLEGKLVRRRGQ